MVDAEFYVDHSLLIDVLNKRINTVNNQLCVSRIHGFGKSVDVHMLVAYYSQGCDTADVFDQLKISKRDSYKKHLNSYHVIYLDMKAFYRETHQVAKMLEMINERVCEELVNAFADVRYFNKK